MTLRLPRLSQSVAMVEANGRPGSTFLRYFNDVLSKLEGQAEDITTQGTEITATTAIATSAATSAATANATATAAATSAATANATATATAQMVALGLSYCDPTSVLTTDPDPTDATKRRITIAAHTRRYCDGSSVAVASGTIAGLTPSTAYFITYLDPDHAGGTVSYSASTNAAMVVQTNGRHLVGSIVTGAV